MSKRFGIACLGLVVASAAHAAKLKPAEVQDKVLGAALQMLVDACEQDDTSPVKVERDVVVDGKPAKRAVGIKGCYLSSPMMLDTLRYAAHLASGGAAPKNPDGTPKSTWDVIAEIKDTGIKTLWGVELVAKRVPCLAGGELVAYSPKAFEKVFKEVYVKPAETRAGVLMQAFYDAVLKDYLGRVAHRLAALKPHLKAIQAKAADYSEKARKGPEFYGPDYQFEYAKTLGPDFESDDRLIGTLMRRHLDGTLPVLLKQLKTVLADYDPETFKQVGASL